MVASRRRRRSPARRSSRCPARRELEMRWPNVLRIETVVRPNWSWTWRKVPALKLDPARRCRSAPSWRRRWAAPTDLARSRSIDLEKLPEEFRLQRLVFLAARKALHDD
jgi:type III restriction enzyme